MSFSNLVTISQINDPNSKRGNWAVKAMALLLQILNTWILEKLTLVGKTEALTLLRENRCKLNACAKTS